MSRVSLRKILQILIGISFVAMVVWVWQGSSHKPADFVTEFQSAYDVEAKENGTTKEFTLVARESELEITENQSTKIWSYNGSVPGPELRIIKGDTLKVTFRNNLSQPTTIHWHGVRVPNAMDGVPGVTQDPILPGEEFVYEFTPKDAGTFWYHPHVRGSEQVERGLYGTLIVEDPDDPVYAVDQILVIDDWRLLDDGTIDPRFNTRHDLMHDGRWGSTITVNGKQGYAMQVRPGERLRLRLLNTSNGRIYKLGFGGLKANVIAVDGMKVGETFSAESFELAPGNRLDVDIVIPDSNTEKNFRITDTFTRKSVNLVNLSVKGNSVSGATFAVPVADHMPVWETAIQAPITQEYALNARRGGTYGIEWTINGKAYPETDPITLKAGEFNKLRFTNESARLHPMHLHGQFFKVVARNGKKVNEPYWRDTVLIHAKETVDIVLVPLDKGQWAMHCHILEHAEAGMMTVVNVQ
ncbi:MAG: multicopper oxidase family protein [Candidatus Paceibacterota bacterium]